MSLLSILILVEPSSQVIKKASAATNVLHSDSYVFCQAKTSETLSSAINSEDWFLWSLPDEDSTQAIDPDAIEDPLRDLPEIYLCTYHNELSDA